MDPHAATSAAPVHARIIGGMFGLETPSAGSVALPDFLQRPHLTMVNARSAMRLAIERLAPRHVWFPSYFCDSMLAAVEGLPTRLRFFGIDASLQVDSDAWLADVQPGDVVVLIEYFGFPCDAVWTERVRARGGVVMIDAAQSLLSDHRETQADLIVYSPRKFVGVADGGVLELRTHREFVDAALMPAPRDWCQAAAQAAEGRREFDRGGGDRLWFAQFQQVEATQPVGNYEMSEPSRDLLGRLEYSQVVQRRRENYGVLLDELRPLAIFPQLPDGVAPLGFPVRLAERERVRQALFAEQIYPPVHWPLAPIVPAEFVASHQLAGEELTLPCDQRYTSADMRHMASIVRREVGR